MKPLIALAAIPAALAPNSTMWTDGMPPVRYQGNGVSVVIVADPEEVAERCANPGRPPPPGVTLVACAWRAENGVPVILLPNPCLSGDTERHARLFCHERAHTNGWPGSHGD